MSDHWVDPVDRDRLTERLSFRLTEGQWAALKNLSRSTGVGANKLLRQAVVLYLRHYGATGTHMIDNDLS